MSYQGWENYPTWCIHLWITNDEGLYNSWRDEARTCLEDQQAECPDCSDEDCARARAANAKHELADKLKDSWEWQSEDLKAQGFWSDLISWALGQVDWHEVAAALMEEIEDE